MSSNGKSGKGRGRGQPGRGSATAQTKKVQGQCSALGNHVFDYGTMEAPDQTRTSWDAFVLHAAAKYGQDIGGELRNRKTLIIPMPEHDAATLDAHATASAKRDSLAGKLKVIKHAKLDKLKPLADGGNEDALVAFLELEYEMDQDETAATIPLPISLQGDAASAHSGAWKTYRKRMEELALNRGKAFAELLGQCTQSLKDKMKFDKGWSAVSDSNEPLKLIALIELLVLAQTSNQYPYAAIYDQEAALYQFKQDQLSNQAWYEQFNTKADVATSIGATHVHRILCQHTAPALYSGMEFKDLKPEEQEDVCLEAEERYLAYVLLRRAGPQHHKLRMDLKNAYTTGNDKYPKTRQSMLHLLDQYTKSHVSNATPHGTSFAQRGGGDNEFDKEYWKDRTCFNCDKKGHPTSACTKPHRTKEQLQKDRAKTKGKPKTDDGTMSVSSKSSSKSSCSKSSKESAFLLTTLMMEVKTTQAKVKRTQALMAVQKKLEDVQETSDGSDISESDDDDAEGNTSLLQYGFLQNCSTSDGAYCFTSNGKQLSLHNTFLLDSQSTTTVICNKKFVTDIRDSNETLSLKSNGGIMRITQQATLKGFEGPVWHSPNAIANILALSDVKRKYRVTYDSDESRFVVHREHTGKSDMYFTEHESGLHSWTPEPTGMAFVETVSGNKQNYTKRQIKGAEKARELYAAVGYPSRRDFRYAVQMKQIVDCPITTEDVDVAHTIWGKSIQNRQMETNANHQQFNSGPAGTLEFTQPSLPSC